MNDEFPFFFLSSLNLCAFEFATYHENKNEKKNGIF